jgi:hypothetical protein
MDAPPRPLPAAMLLSGGLIDLAAVVLTLGCSTLAALAVHVVPPGADDALMKLQLFSDHGDHGALCESS